MTIIESFRGLFDDLEGNLKQHMQDFQTKVDASESAKMESNYLMEVQEDIKEVYEDLESQEDIIAETIKEVSDITTADVPTFSEVTDAKDEAIEKTEEVEEDLESFNGTSEENDVEAILSQIESVMEKAQTSKGTARFSDFKGASGIKNLAKLQDYNEHKKVEEEKEKEKEKEKELEDAKDAKESALKDQNKHSSRDVINKAYEEYKNGDIDYNQYTAVLDSVKNTDGNMDGEELEEETAENFIKYLEDRDMLDQYLDDHKQWAAYVVDSMLGMLYGYGVSTISLFAENAGKNLEEVAEDMIESDSEIKSKTKLNDPEYSKKADALLKRSKNIMKAGTALGGAFAIGDVVYGMYDDTQNNNMTSGEAYTHNAGKAGAAITGDAAATGLTYLGAIALSSNPGGWAIAAGMAGAVVGTTAFNYFYDNNKGGFRDKMDFAGEKVDEFTDKASEKIGEFKDDVGEAINSNAETMNPFS